jgi:hypothetical protein
MIKFHWPAGRVYILRDGFSTLQEFNTQEEFTTGQEKITILKTESLSCRSYLPPLGMVHYPAGVDHPREGFTTLKEVTTLRKGLLPCRRLPVSGRVNYPAGGYHSQKGFTTLQEVFTTLGKGSIRRSSPLGDDPPLCRCLPLSGRLYYPARGFYHP